MYAIVDIAGQQIKVEKNQEVFVNRLEEKQGAKVQFDNVLLIDNDGKVEVGTPVIDGAAVSAKILEHLKADKVLVFKKKRRKGYKTLNGHRQFLSKIVIEDINAKGLKKAAAPKAEKVVKETPQTEAPKVAAKKTAAKKVAAKVEAPAKEAPKAAAKKVAAKKTAAKKVAAKKEDK